MNDKLFEKASSLAIVSVLVIACLKIVSPFLGALLWGIIIAVSTWPMYGRLQRRAGGRQWLAAVIMTLAMVLVFIVPVSLLVYSLAEYVASVSGLVKDLTAMTLPETPTWLAEAPVIGPRLDMLWHRASNDMPVVLDSVRPAAKQGLAWLLKHSGNLTLSMLEFLFAIVLSGFICANGVAANALISRLIDRIAGASGHTLLTVAGQTIRSVSAGVVGTALIQALMSVIGFAVAGVPGAGLLGLFCFILAMLQVGTALVWIPTALWLGYHDDMGWAVFTVIWGIIINISDNFIKPYLISQSGSGLPVPLIFIGVLGGLLAWGLIGIFVGSTLLVVCYKLLYSWLDLEQPVQAAAESEPDLCDETRPR